MDSELAEALRRQQYRIGELPMTAGPRFSGEAGKPSPFFTLSTPQRSRSQSPDFREHVEEGSLPLAWTNGVTQADESEKSFEKLLCDWQFEIFNRFPREEAMQLICFLKKMEFERGQTLAQARQERLQSKGLMKRISDLEGMHQNFTAEVHGSRRQQQLHTEQTLRNQSGERCGAKTQVRSSVGLVTLAVVLVALMSWYAGSIVSGRKCVSGAGAESISSDAFTTRPQVSLLGAKDQEWVHEAAGDGHAKIYDPKVVEKIMTENQEMRVQLERLWTDVEGAMKSGQEMVCWRVK